MKAMIFAAGIGRRLGVISSVRPKALLEINGKSLLRMAVEKLTVSGFNDIIVNVHHFADMVVREANDLAAEGYSITVSDESDLLLETGGGLYKAKWFFDQEPFLLYNADIISEIDLSALYKSHKSSNGLATLAVAQRNDNRVFLTDNDGILCGWQNRQTGEKIISRKGNGSLAEISFSGIHVVNPDIFSKMKEGIYSMTSLYLSLAKSHRIYTFRHDEDFWADIGTPDELNRVRIHFGDNG
jgi:NDP-sugar pyrophosphorylase family protein